MRSARCPLARAGVASTFPLCSSTIRTFVHETYSPFGSSFGLDPSYYVTYEYTPQTVRIASFPTDSEGPTVLPPAPPIPTVEWQDLLMLSVFVSVLYITY